MADLFDLISTGDLAALREALHADATTAAARNAAGTSLLAHAGYLRNSEAIAAIRLTLLGIDPYEACILGDTERIEAALADRWDANALAPDGFTALSLAAFFGHAAIFDLLLPVTGDLNQRAANPQQVAALHAATAVRNITMVEKLLRAGADPDLPQAEGYRPIHVAAQRGDAPIAGLLLLYGADPLCTNDKGESAIDQARAGGHPWLAERLAARLTKS